MVAGVDLPEGLDADMGVNLRGVEAGVAEHFLDVADVRAVLMHVGGAGVAEQVRRAGLADPDPRHLLGDPSAEVGGGEGGAVAGKEEGGLGRQVGDQRAGFGEVAGEPEGSVAADGEQAALAVLSPADEEGAGVGIVVADLQPSHLGAADAGGVEEFEDGAVAEAERAAGVGQREQAVDFLGTE